MSDILKKTYNQLKIGSKNLYLKATIPAYNHDNFINSLAGALARGVDIIELSGRNVESGLFFNIAKTVKLLCAQFDATFIINERADIAFLTDADGIFLTDKDISIHSAKELLKENIIIGSESEENADYIVASYSEDINNLDIPCFLYNSTLDTDSCEEYISKGITQFALPSTLLDAESSISTITEFKKLFLN